MELYSEPPLIDYFKKIEQEILITNSAFYELIKAVLVTETPLRFHAKGFSMLPFIKDGDLVTLSPLTASRPGLGEVIAFIHPETKRVVIHRIISKKNGYSLILKGDNSTRKDILFQRNNILGYVTKVERDGKKVFLGLGPERFLIVFLSRMDLIMPLFRTYALFRR